MKTAHSFKVDDKLWDEFRIHCIKKKKKLGEVLEELIKNEIKER